MASNPSKKITQIHDKCWLWFQRIIRRWIRLSSASSRWGFAASLLAFSLFSISLAPSIRVLEGEMIIFSWVCCGNGIAFFIILLSFISFISRNAPEDEDTDKSLKAIVRRFDRLIEIMEHKENGTTK